MKIRRIPACFESGPTIPGFMLLPEIFEIEASRSELELLRRALDLTRFTDSPEDAVRAIWKAALDAALETGIVPWE